MFTVRVEYDGQTHDIPCADGQSILDAVEASGHWDEVPCSCRAGVCTTCAAWLLSGEVDAPFATLVEDIQQQGFILTCSSTPKSGSEMVHVRLGAFETVYHMQYGRFEANTEKS
ncbi:hypothetical protein CDCA_CDCA09G2678 [Cyanidium caldarium]|uniref:2Fe-2S ferredoxin-type domain-containing protein n=1 Tax=Cyanidium caldarium TaxID=2771 RepID=A0AAV9IWI6_CYACA|nr:hypothetical protein CDCA_CDCA09G2678 [Cyanidium caldarium]